MHMKRKHLVREIETCWKAGRQKNPKMIIFWLCLGVSWFRRKVRWWFYSVRVTLELTYSVCTEAESKEKHGVWDPMPELTITSPYVHSRVDSNTFTMVNQPYARVDLNPTAESTLSPSQGLRIWPLYNSPLVSLRKSPTPFKRKSTVVYNACCKFDLLTDLTDSFVKKKKVRRCTVS